MNTKESCKYDQAFFHKKNNISSKKQIFQKSLIILSRMGKSAVMSVCVLKIIRK
mgnify:CR=1 FL=1